MQQMSACAHDILFRISLYPSHVVISSGEREKNYEYDEPIKKIICFINQGILPDYLADYVTNDRCVSVEILQNGRLYTKMLTLDPSMHNYDETNVDLSILPVIPKSANIQHGQELHIEDPSIGLGDVNNPYDFILKATIRHLDASKEKYSGFESDNRDYRLYRSMKIRISDRYISVNTFLFEYFEVVIRIGQIPDTHFNGYIYRQKYNDIGAVDNIYKNFTDNICPLKGNVDVISNKVDKQAIAGYQQKLLLQGKGKNIFISGGGSSALLRFEYVSAKRAVAFIEGTDQGCTKDIGKDSNTEDINFSNADISIERFIFDKFSNMDQQIDISGAIFNKKCSNSTPSIGNLADTNSYYKQFAQRNSMFDSFYHSFEPKAPYPAGSKISQKLPAGDAFRHDPNGDSLAKNIESNRAGHVDMPEFP